MSANEIRIHVGEYKDAVNAIQEGQTRSSKNNDNFKDHINVTNVPSVLKYKEALDRLKDQFQKYNQLLVKDISNMSSIGHLIEEEDKALARR